MVTPPLESKLVHIIEAQVANTRDRKSTRLNSSHVESSYAVFCLKKKNAFASPHYWCFRASPIGIWLRPDKDTARALMLGTGCYPERVPLLPFPGNRPSPGVLSHY